MNIIIIILFIILFLLVIYWIAPNLSLMVWVIIIGLSIFIIYEYYFNLNQKGGFKNVCIKTGCSGQICSNEPKISTCEWKCEYNCYKKAKCMSINGECQWDVNEEMKNCLNSCKSNSEN